MTLFLSNEFNNESLPYLNLTNYLTSHTTPDCSMFLWTWWRSQLNTRDSWHPLCLGSLGVMILKYLESLKMILSEEKKQNRKKLKSLKVVIVGSLLRLKILSARNVVIILLVLTFVAVSLRAAWFVREQDVNIINIIETKVKDRRNEEQEFITPIEKYFYTFIQSVSTRLTFSFDLQNALKQRNLI